MIRTVRTAQLLKYCLPLFLLSCDNESTPSKTELQVSLKNLQQAKDSVSRLYLTKQQSVFELELVQLNDTATANFRSLQQEAKQLEMQVKWLEQKIENTQAELYKPE